MGFKVPIKSAKEIYSRYTRPLRVGESLGSGCLIFYKKKNSDWKHVTIVISGSDMIHGSEKAGEFIKRSCSMPVYTEGQRKEIRKIYWDKVVEDCR
jgi:cell wall-associated NlpC family hydrolase